MPSDVNGTSEFIARFNFSEVTTLDPNRHVSREAVWFGIYCNFALYSCKFGKCLLKKSLTVSFTDSVKTPKGVCKSLVGIFCSLDACGKLSIFPQKSFHLSNFLHPIADLYSFVLQNSQELNNLSNLTLFQSFLVNILRWELEMGHSRSYASYVLSW